MFILAGKHVVVTGGGSGIGRAVAVRFAAEGASVAVLGDRWGEVDVLVNNAGVNHPSDAISSDWDEWRVPIRVSLEGAAHCCRALVPMMPDGGRIVNVASIHSTRVEMGGSSYSVAKGGLVQYTRALALELAPRRILVNAIAPGFIETPMSVLPDGTRELETDGFRKQYIEGHRLPLSRAGDPEEVAGVAMFLSGPDATYITGQTITVDGGLTITF